MNRTGASGGMQPHDDRYLRAARAAIGGNRRELTSKELKIARHLAQDGSSMEEIKTALGWNMGLANFILKLKKVNIRSRRRGTGINGHLSGNPTFDGQRTTRVSGRSYQPKAVR